VEALEPRRDTDGTAVEISLPAGASRRLPLRPLLRTLRPHQWVKNVFVLAPLIFAKRLDEWVPLAVALAAFVVFCLLSGVVYLINDLVDVEADRRHPHKRHRPIAAGALPQDAARKAVAVIGVLAVGASFGLDWRFGLAAVGYLGLNLAYSLWAKQVAYLDVVCVATGFLLRVVAGALAIQVPVSPWLVLCAFLLALFLALGKRRQELRMSGGAGDTRAVLLRYTPATLDMAAYAVGFFTLIAYLIYTVSPRTREHFDTDLLPATTPFVAFGLWRFLSVVDNARIESPTEAILRDPPFVVNIVLWVSFILMAIYVNP